MSFYRYIVDKRYFLALYVSLMLAASLIMLLGVDRARAWNDIAYMNMVCFLLAALYVVIGYGYRQSFYRALEQTISSAEDEAVHALPEPQNHEQALCLALVQRLHQGHSRQLQMLIRDKQDHQDFIMSWIHEVKLPIAAGRLLLGNSAGKSADYLADKFEDELDKIDHYVEQALYYSRIDSFSRDYYISETSPIRIVRQSVKKYAKLFINKRIRFAIEEEAAFERQLVHSDSKWLAFIVDQMIANAVKYTGEGGTVTASFEEDGSQKRLIIRDTGIGIEAGDLHRVFDRGFTGASGRKHGKSTGMGLYLAKQLALKLGHDLSVRSEEGAFTMLIVHFPKIRRYHEL